MARVASDIFYACRVHAFLVGREKQEGKKSLKYGYALRYGKYAIVYASSLAMDKGFRSGLHSRSLAEIEQYVNSNVPLLLDKWKIFEDSIQQLKGNKTYFNAAEQLADFDTYYKGTTLKADVEKHFSVP